MAKAKKNKTKKRVIIFGGLFLLVAALVIVVLSSGDKEKIISVQTENTEKRTITEVVDATGKIHPFFQVELRPEVTGEIVELPIKEGDFVKKGQLLIKIKPEQYVARRNRARAFLQAAKANLRISEATLEQVDSEYKRVQGLFEKGLASSKEMEAAKANYQQSVGSYEAQKASVMQAQESYNDAEVELAKTEILSPIDGKITALPVELSERVLGSSFSQGTHLLTVADIGNIEARVDVDENDVVKVSVGDTAVVEIDAFGDEKEFIGIVSQIGNSAMTTGFGTQNEVVNFEVRIKVLNPVELIRSGMSCDASIQTETRYDVIGIPIQSVTSRVPKEEKSKEDTLAIAEETSGEQEFAFNDGEKKEPIEVVFINDDGKSRMVPVKTGISDDNFIEIVEGLDEGVEIISGPYRAVSRELEDDTKIMVPRKKGDKNKSSIKEEEKTQVAEN